MFQYVVNATVKKVEAEWGENLQYRRLINGYRRFDPSRGMDYRLDLAFRDTTTGREVHKRLKNHIRYHKKISNIQNTSDHQQNYEIFSRSKAHQYLSLE